MGDWKSIKINGIAKIEKLVADESYLRFLVFFLKIFYFQKSQKIIDSQKIASYHYQYIPYIREYGINNNLSEALL
ncbi:Restriction endonuclease subunit S [Brevibacillus sp. IT-7CA2]